MKNKIFNTNNDWIGFVTRFTAGIVLFPHGAQKMLGMFGGYGFSETMSAFTTQMHLPWIMAFSVIIIEFFGSLSLIIGFASRVWSAAAVLHIALVEKPAPEDTEIRSQLDKSVSDANEAMQLPAEPANGPGEGGKS